VRDLTLALDQGNAVPQDVQVVAVHGVAAGQADLPAELVGDLRALIEQVHTPLAIRSSSRLEDALYRPFAGVYATKMIPNNQPDADTRFRRLVEAVKFAKTFTDDVEFSPEDACRSEMPFLIAVLTAVVEAGATTLNIPDTVGYVLPYEYGRIIAQLKAEVKGIGKCVISTHCHNDYGLANANVIAAVTAGCEVIDLSVNGLGDRAA
jgi:hypothetical protein